MRGMRASPCVQAALFNLKQISLGGLSDVWARARDAGGGRSARSNLSDAFEAVIAALYTWTAALETARAFILPRICHRRAHGRRRRRGLQDKAAGDRAAEPGGACAMLVTDESGPDHNQLSWWRCISIHNFISKGEGHSKSWPSSRRRRKPTA